MTNEFTTQETTGKSFEVSRDIADYTHRQKAVGKLKKSHIFFPAPPGITEWHDHEGQFVMPNDVSAIPYHELGRLFSVLNSLLQWYGAVLAGARVDKLTAERVKNFTEAKARMEILADGQMKKDYKAREDKDAYVNINEEVMDAQNWFDSQESLVIMTEQLYKDYDRSFQLVSREITRRGFEGGHDNREGNLR